MAKGASQSSTGVILTLAAVATAAALWFLLRSSPQTVDLPTDATGGVVPVVVVPREGADSIGADEGVPGTVEGAVVETDESPSSELDGAEPEEQTEEDREAEEIERRVEAFDALTDRWREPVEKGCPVSLEQIEAFRRQFKDVPKDRKEECLQRALNLIPDENVMVLAGILLDKGEARELVELVFQDVLNRDESCKQPILKEIFKDKTHPCWADTAWILDVTGELSGTEKQPEN